MNWKNRLTNYNFWISIVSAVLLILQAFEFHFDIMYINEIATAVLGLLVVIGIINDPTKSGKNDKSTDVNSKSETGSEAENSSINNLQNLLEEKQNEQLTETKDENQNFNLNEEIQNFPIDEQNQIVDINSENDYENIIKTITSDINDEELKLEEMLKNLLNLLKNTEKNSKNAEIFEKFLKNEEISENKINNSNSGISLSEQPIDNQNDLNNFDSVEQAGKILNNVQNDFQEEDLKQNFISEEILDSANADNSSFDIVN